VFLLPQVQIYLLTKPIKHILGDNTDSISKRSRMSTKMPELECSFYWQKGSRQSNFHHFWRK